MNLNESLCYLSKEFENQTIPFKDDNYQQLKSCFNMIENNIHVLETNTIPPEDFLKQDNTKNLELATKSLFILVKYLLTQSITKNNIIFIIKLSEFIYNWNQNLTKDETINLVSRFIYQYCLSIEQMQDSIETLQNTLNIYQALRDWMPPAYDIAKVYCEELFKNNEQ